MSSLKILDKILLKIYFSLKRRVDDISVSNILNNKDYLLKVGPGFKFDFEKNVIKVEPAGKIEFGNDVHFREFCNIYVFKNAKLILSDNVFFNRYCSINCLGEIEIGRYTIFGEGVKLYDHNHMYNDIDSIIQKNDCTIGKIKIGSNCWIGANVTILNNVEIGDNVVIGAGNLIYKNIPSNVVVKNKSEKIITSRI